MTTTPTAASEAATATIPAYDELIRLVREANLLTGTARLLGWDQETMMPPGGVTYRSRQLAQLARMIHQMKTQPRIGELLAACEADGELLAAPLSDAAVNVREIRREYDRATKLPPQLVEELARTTSMAKAAWAEARRVSDFAQFKPHLAKIIELTKRKAEHYRGDGGGASGGASGGLWDQLADAYEPGCTAEQVRAVFDPLRPRLVELVGRLTQSGSGPADRFNALKLPIDRQEAFVRFVAERIGFDFSRGRLDASVHPFCGGSNPNDIRMTTRYREDMLPDALGSVMHESGHGIYNQGLPTDERSFDTPRGSFVSLGIHESQSRMIENQVGRSLPFWKWCHPRLAEFFGDAVAGLSLEDAYGGVNVVQPSLIRVEADEATYNLHIMIRFDLEIALIDGGLPLDDLPGEWNRKYKDYLDIDVPDDTRGVLQDIHWSMGSFGYFPTYTLGNLYAAQFFEQALSEMPDLYEQFARGEFGGLKAWLNEKIHAHGMRYRAAELCEHVTGKPLSADALLRHLEGKLLPLYGVGG